MLKQHNTTQHNTKQYLEVSYCTVTVLTRIVDFKFAIESKFKTIILRPLRSLKGKHWI